MEGPFGEFTGTTAGCNMTVVRIDKVSYRTRPIFELSSPSVCRGPKSTT
ncbi:UbiD family decarboxylase domain-containing protein [Escherichia coli]